MRCDATSLLVGNVYYRVCNMEGVGCERECNVVRNACLQNEVQHICNLKIMKVYNCHSNTGAIAVAMAIVAQYFEGESTIALTHLDVISVAVQER